MRRFDSNEISEGSVKFVLACQKGKLLVALLEFEVFNF